MLGSESANGTDPLTNTGSGVDAETPRSLSPRCGGESEIEGLRSAQAA